MPWIASHLWLIPLLPFLAGGVSALLPRRCRKLSAGLAIGAIGISTLLSFCALAESILRGLLPHAGRQWSAMQTHEAWHWLTEFTWFSYGTTSLKLGFVLDPLTAAMATMVSFVSMLIFIYSLGYMDRDKNFTRFFTFLSLFAGAMLGLVVANNLLLFFICWELVGVASYLLIGFWYHRPSAAAAAKKAFIVTKLGDIGFFAGLLWLYHATGTLQFYTPDHTGALEQATALAGLPGIMGLSLAGTIALLIFCGAVGKSGQWPLHVWLPDAMEGPTPVSALIHAATMVAAGVFLVARTYPLFQASPQVLTLVAWIGAFTAIMAATIAIAQNDIKRILAYSTVSQLGYMVMGLGVGGMAAAMFHLLMHGFFKALLFLGAGSVIHGCHNEQDVFKMGGVKKHMPVTFWTYFVGTLALAGIFPLAGFWSKDEVLTAAFNWGGGWFHKGPFALGCIGVFLTAFYMWRQVCLVFLGEYRGEKATVGHKQVGHEEAETQHETVPGVPHESPAVMTVPLVILAIFSAFMGFSGLPEHANLIHHFLSPEHAPHHVNWFVIATASALAFAGLGVGHLLYGVKPLAADEPDPLKAKLGKLRDFCRDKWYWDELYEATVVRFANIAAVVVDLGDRLLDGVTVGMGLLARGLSFINDKFDEHAINRSFDGSCGTVRLMGRCFAALQDGRVQSYLRLVAVAAALLAFWFFLK
ncbi:MAG: NADH-quinone oxidoreductase subunit L [Verrucomicrobia bacterium]|nr:NADH-quinone oxidoreductase subunit L [Verrucomicrobiota bacterium]